ncbi:MAG: aminotransferase class III-fold pyridoxal phosphate-dependent enzyme, partial [Planctomycetales bacterium]|nr:aminotransferase class III-fold pyridoxal phosphate-dependent enzyme [Planctomycetales bacterium]
MSDKHWSFDEYANIWLPYCQMKTAPEPIKVVATAREFMTLADGRKVIDGIASWWTACHGYNHPHIVEAVKKQLDAMPHVMLGGLCHDQALRLTTRLASLLPGTLNRVFLADSGSVAVEVALKIAAQFWINRGYPNRKKFVCFQNAYHGDTTGA